MRQLNALYNLCPYLLDSPSKSGVDYHSAEEEEAEEAAQILLHPLPISIEEGRRTISGAAPRRESEREQWSLSCSLILFLLSWRIPEEIQEYK